ncbi:putative gonadotropin-releasing hormone II receptor [Paramacrobiotus metropolitanus]|uniref:putative gonadotropin-releasing hormone II receptor n=1 Tax=Paramacrobiotus metropolitanus TaxID=2943436 RepID=UPI002445D494|nr:putative gonadotropin-releasing hormone II receptor [Paramacrobiotus metropolitanus]
MLGILSTTMINETAAIYPTLKEDIQENYSRKIHIGILFSLSALAATGNMAVIGKLSYNRLRQHFLTNIDFLILNLAIADLLVAVFCLFTDAVWKCTYEWLAGDLLCKVIKFMQMFALYASTFSTAIVAVDRCIAIRLPIKRINHRRIMRSFILGSWTCATLLSFPQVLIFRVLRSPGRTEDERFDQCVTYGAYTESWQEPAYIFFTFSVMFILPFLIIIASYILIVSALRQQSTTDSATGLRVSDNYSGTGLVRRTTSDNSSADEKRGAFLRKAKRKSLYVSILVIMTFLLCWVPYYCSVIYYVVVHQQTETTPKDHEIFQYIFCFGMSSAVLNPLVYGAFHMSQRRGNFDWKISSSRASYIQHCQNSPCVPFREHGGSFSVSPAKTFHHRNSLPTMHCVSKNADLFQFSHVHLH